MLTVKKKEKITKIYQSEKKNKEQTKIDKTMNGKENAS